MNEDYHEDFDDPPADKNGNDATEGFLHINQTSKVQPCRNFNFNFSTFSSLFLG